MIFISVALQEHRCCQSSFTKVVRLWIISASEYCMGMMVDCVPLFSSIEAFTLARSGHDFNANERSFPAFNLQGLDSKSRLSFGIILPARTAFNLARAREESSYIVLKEE